MRVCVREQDPGKMQNRKWDWISFLMGSVVLLFLLGGLLRIADYGVSYDEPLEYRTSVYTWEYVKATALQIANGEKITDTTGFLSYSDNVYGCAARMPVFWLFSAGNGSREIFLGWHVYTYIWFAAAAFCMYVLLKEIGFHRRLAWLGSFMYVLMPRLMAEASYNIKDSLFLSLFTVTLCLGCLLVKRRSTPRCIVYAFFLALCANTRYIGAAAFVPVPVCLLLLERDRKWIPDLVTTAVCSLFFYYLMTPFLWTDPAGHLIRLVFSFTNNEERYVSMWFAGRQTGADALPWYYLSLWMGLTIPLWILGCFACGAVVGARHLIGEKKAGTRRIWSLRSAWLCSTAALLAVAVLADAALHTVKYDGWRHFYFLYALLVPVAVYGFAFVLKNRKAAAGKLALGAFAFLLAADLYWPLFLHPYQMVYMNPLGMTVNDRFETDYWLVSMTGAIREILSETVGPVRIWLGWDTGLYLLTEEESRRVLPAESIYEADYVIMYDRVYRWDGTQPGMLPGFAVWKEKRVGDGLLYHILVPDGSHTQSD